MSEELNRYRVPEEIRKQVLAGIKEELVRNGGSITYAEIGGRVLRNLQINWNDYAGGVKKLSEWVPMYFPELEPLPENRGVTWKGGLSPAEARDRVPREVRDQVAAAVRETLGGNDTALLSELGHNIVARGVERKKYTNEGLGEWVRGLVPGFQKSGDGLTFSWKAPDPASGQPVHVQITYPPAEKDLSQADLDENVRQMHTLAYMGWWNNNVRVLKRYTGHSGSDTRIWSGIVAQHLTDVLLGRRQAILGTPMEGVSCAAFYSGLDTQEGKPIYCIMVPNKDKKAQAMMLLDFCWPGNEENPALGSWLAECLEDQSPDPVPGNREQIRLLEQSCTRLEALREELKLQLQQALDCLAAGAVLPTDRFPGMKTYNELHGQVRELSVAVEVPREHTAPGEILDWCSRQNPWTAVIERFTQSFGLLTESMTTLVGGIAFSQPDLTRDREALGRACEEFAARQDSAPLRALLKPYEQLREIMSGPVPGPDLIAITNGLDRHFGIRSMMCYAAQHRPELQEELGRFDDRLKLLRDQFDTMDRMNRVRPEPAREKPPLPDPRILLEKVCADDLTGLWTGCGGENRLETLVLEDRIPEALAMACDREAMLEAGYDDQTRQEIWIRLADEQNLPGGYGLYHMALRLQRVLGISNATAERYFLMGLFADRGNCVTELLNIYRRTGRQTEFVTLWERFGSLARYSGENYLYYLTYLREHQLEQVQGYLDSHVFLYHLPAFAGVLGDASCAPEETAPVNPLEEALLADDRQKIRALLAEPKALENMGYSAGQITQISQAAISEDIPQGTDLYPTGVRLYRYQGNLHALAENCLWESLARTPTTEISNKLVQLLAGEGRWQECIRLYNCYASLSGISNDCRQAYLMAMLQTEPVKVQQEIRANLQGFLAMAHRDPRAAQTVDAYRNSSSEDFRAFYDRLHGILQVLAEDYPRSVLLHDRSFRELVTQSALLADLSLDDRLLESARATYQSGSYPQGPDAESVARRAYIFLGNYHGIAESLARFCLPARGGLMLLWNIVCDNGDTQEQQVLLQNYPAIRELYPHAYSNYLYRTEQYELFLAWLEGYRSGESSTEPLPEEVLQQQIALLRRDPGAQITSPVPEGPLTPERMAYLARLGAVLVEADRLEDTASLLLDHFEWILGSCCAESLKQIMTAEGRLSPAAAQTIQARAVDGGALKAAIYYYNTLGIGDLGRQADAYYQTVLEQCAGEPLETQLLRMEELAKLYPGRQQDLQDQMYRMHIYGLLKTEPYTKAVQSRLAEQLDKCTLDTRGVRSLLADVQQSVYAGGDGVIQSIVRLTRGDELLNDGLVYLHRTAEAASRTSGISEVLCQNLCRRYLEALNQGSFPRELGSGAEQLCRRILLANGKYYEAAFCLFRIEMLLEHRSRAECVLRYLSRQATQELGSLYPVVEAAGEDFWEGKAPGVFPAFMAYVQNHTPDEILSYCDFCKIFSHTSDEDWTVAHGFIQNLRQQSAGEGDPDREYSTETEGEALVKVLCADPDKANYWWACAMLPGLSPVVRAKLLFVCAGKNPAIYKDCAQLCADSGLNGLLLQALQKWVEAPSPGPKNCRSYVADLLSQEPGFFDRWVREDETAQLMKLHEALCRDAREDLANIPSSVAHKALNAISVITVAIGSREAVEQLEGYLSEPLLNLNAEVGVATVLRLLLARRSHLGGSLLEGLYRSSAPIACRRLVEQLHSMTPEALSRLQDSQVHRMLWELLEPDGNRPNAEDIYRFVMGMVREGRVQEGACVLNMLLDMFPGDLACCDALFLLCKYDMEDRIPLLHKALCGLVSSTTQRNSYYRRNVLWNARLLAGLNAVIKAKGLEQEVARLNPHYDFNQEAGRFCMTTQSAITGDDVKNINSVQRELTQDLQNLHAEVLDWKCRGILCWITGDWAEYLYTAWQDRAGDGDISRIREALQYGSVQFERDSVGFCRSLLRAAARLEREQQGPFLQWVWKALGRDEGPIPERNSELTGKLRQTAMAYDLIEAAVPGKIGDMPLDIPLEEYTLTTEVLEQYITPWAGRDTQLLYNRLWLLGAVVDYAPMMLYQYNSRAQTTFRDGEFQTAAAYYEAMLRLLSRGLCQNKQNEPALKPEYRYCLESYESYARISRLRAGDPAILKKVGAPGFHVWSCVNMVIAMICSPRGNEALQMAESFSRNNRALARAILRAIDPNVSDRKKLDMLNSYPQSLEKAFLAFILRSGRAGSNNEDFVPRFFKDSESSRKAKSVFVALAKQYPENFNLKNSANPTPRHFIMSKFNLIHAISYKQLPVAESADAPDTDSPERIPEESGQRLPVREAVLPGFAQGLTPLEQPDRLKQLRAEHSQLPRFQHNARERLDRSREIYRIRLSGNVQTADRLSALIQFGLDYYDHLDLDNPEEYAEAYRAVTELALYGESLRGAAEGAERTGLDAAMKPLADTVESDIIYSLLDKGHMSIQSLADQFAQDRKAFDIMREMVRKDETRREALDTIYSALDLLIESYSSRGNAIVLRNALNRARGIIGGIHYGVWLPLKNKLQGLIQNEINNIDRRPILDLEIQNRGINPEEDYLYGEVRNEGMETAADITLQVAYEDSSSNRLRLAQLAPGERVAFKVRYSAPEGATSLRYSINWSYMLNGKSEPLPIKEDTLTISPRPDPTFPVNQYETQTITDFYEDEKGVLGNPNFFGRERETEALRNLFRSGRFPSYNNAIVYGIRRAGKTTLLNYVQAYVNLHCSDAIIVKVDCLINTGTRLVQSLFVDRVLSAIQIQYPQLTEGEDWQQLVEKWSLSQEAADRDPNSLEQFYHALKRVTGKGLVLMLDEVDNFFTSVEQQTSLDSYLFQVLSNMLCSASCQQAVHFIFCGSKYLLRYRNGDGGLSQLFQRFGSNVIEVGLIPKREMEQMIRKPYEAYPQVQITDEAIDWIWEYTQGLVWHVKLLANMVLEHVRDSRRSVVYPVDVKDNIHTLVNKAYCEQFFDGINGKEQDKRERLVIDAMQSMATLRTSYVPKGVLQQLLTSGSLPAEYTMTMDQLENALDNLIKLKLVTYSESNRAYRFAVDLYRMYFRNQRDYPFVFKKMEAPEPTFVRV